MSIERKSVFATLPRTERGRPIVLGADPKGQNFLYTNGNSVIIRDVEKPEIADVYTQHSKQTTVAKYAPSGFYIASGDVSGKLRIWDTTQKEHILKYEYQPLSGAIKDIAWSPDSKRLILVGEGREKFGAAIMWDTGTSVGEIIGHSKTINSCDFKPTRPFRVVTASEDHNSAFYEGPPFKFKHSSIDEHSSFVNCIRYSPNGEKYLTGGADGKCFIHEGKTGETIEELGKNGAKSAHAAGVYGLSWSADSTQVLSVSADKTAKIWDVAQNQVVTEFTMGTDLMDQQVGCLWMGDYLLSVSLSGHINYLDKNNPTTPYRVLKGHNKPITCLEASSDRSTLYSGSSTGAIKYWSPTTGMAECVGGNEHSNQVYQISAGVDNLVTVSMDDTSKTIDPTTQTLGNSIGLDSQPKAIANGKDGLVVIATIKEIVVFRNGQKVFSQPEKYEPNAVAINPAQTEVAVGGNTEDQKVHIYKLENDTLHEENQAACKGAITCLAYSSDGVYLAASDTGRAVTIFNTSDWVPLRFYTAHTARVNTLAWSPDNRHLASGGLDTHLIVTTLENLTKKIIYKAAHPLAQLTGLTWLDNNTIVSTGQDCNIIQWTLKE